MPSIISVDSVLAYVFKTVPFRKTSVFSPVLISYKSTIWVLALVEGAVLKRTLSVKTFLERSVMTLTPSITALFPSYFMHPCG